MKNKKTGLVGNQKGMVSIIVTMILIILMTLIVLAMSQNANREQRQALDRQLSDQAFYNAESGINDWANYLYENPTAAQVKDDCETDKNILQGSPDFPGEVPDQQIDGPDGVNTYSCVLYDKAPTNLEYDNIDTTDSIIVPIEPIDLPGSSQLNTLEFTLKTGEGDTVTTGCNIGSSANLPQSLPNGCNVDGLRIDLINSNGTRADITKNNFPVFIVPSNGGGNINYTPGTTAEQGLIGRADCRSGNSCVLKINNLGLSNGERLYLHMRGMYGGLVDVSITGCHANAPVCPNTQKVNFSNGQIELDVTGKANDVLRRVQVRLPIQNQYDTPGSFSLRTSQAVCKLITVYDPNSQAQIDGRCPL